MKLFEWSFSKRRSLRLSGACVPGTEHIRLTSGLLLESRSTTLTLPFIILCLLASDLHDFNDNAFFSIQSRCDEMQSHFDKDKRVVMALTHFIAKLSLRICILIKVRDLEDKRLLRIHALVITCLPSLFMYWGYHENRSRVLTAVLASDWHNSLEKF